jgi:hypothetical protein
MNLNNQVHGEKLIPDTTTNPKFRGGLLPYLMVESATKVLVKEERRQEAIPSAVPPPMPLCFTVFDLRLRPS